MSWNIELPEGEWFDDKSPGLQQLVADMGEAVEVAIDTETSGLDLVRDRAYYWSVSWGERRICMPASTLPYFDHLFKDPSRIWIMANAKFDMHMLQNVGVKFAGVIADVAVMHALLYEEMPHDLKGMTKQILGWSWKSFVDTFGKTKKNPKEGELTTLDLLQKMEKEDKQKLVEYAANDAYGTLQLYHALLKELESIPIYSLYPEQFNNLGDYFWKLQAPFTKVLYKMERNGCYIDKKHLTSVHGSVEKRIDDLRLREMVRYLESLELGYLFGGSCWMFKPGSDPHLRAYFFDYKKYPITKQTKGGAKGVKQASVDKFVLQHIVDEYDDPLAKMVLEWSKLSTLLKTYVVGIQRQTDHRGRAHYRFNQDIARTGRLSSSNLNIQNIPRRDGDTFHIRDAFAARPGYALIVADYEQLEMRLLACAAMEPGMIDIFRRNWDIHMGNAALVFGPTLKKKYDREFGYDDFKAAKELDEKLKQPKKFPDFDPASISDLEKAICADLMFYRQAVKAVSFG